MLRIALRYIAFGSVLFGLAGCGWLFGGDDDDLQPAPPLPEVSGMESRVIKVFPGDLVRIEVRMTDAQGQPFEPYSFVVGSQIHRQEGGGGWSEDGTLLCDSPTTIDAPSDGVRVISFTAGQRGQCIISGRVQTCGGRRDTPCVETLSKDLGPVFVEIRGGETDSIVPLQPSVTIVPGEIRPVSAIPMNAPDKDGLLYPSGQDWTVSVADPSVAVVVGPRSVKGVSVGATTLEFRSADAVATIPVTVVDGTVSAPPDGRHRLEVIDFDGVTDTGDIRDVPVTLTYPIYPNKHRMALDPKGWPSAVFEASAVQVQWHTVLHMEWTGSGFGIQQVGEFRESYWQPNYAVDDAGVRYMALQSGVLQGLHMAVQKPGDEPGVWKFTELGRRLDIRNESSDPLIWVNDRQLDMDRERMSIQARKGGGAWLAYVVWIHDASDPVTPCVRMLRLATATATGVEVQDVEEFRFTEGVSGCEATARINGFDVGELLLLPPDPGRNLPRILVLQRQLNQAWSYPWVYDAAGAQWQRSEWPMDSLKTGLSNIYVNPVEAVVPTPTPDGESSRLVWSMNLDSDSDVFDLAHFGWGFGDGPHTVCFCDPGSPLEMFALQNDGNVWVGDGNLSPLIKFTSHGRIVMDWPELQAPIDGQTAEFAAMNYVYGWMADQSRMFFLASHSGYRLDLVTLTPPTMVRDGALDTEGARLGDIYTANPLSLQPYALSDGTVMMYGGARYDLINRHEVDSLSHVWRADPPSGLGGVPWNAVMSAVPTKVFEAPSQFFQVEDRPGTLYGIMREENTPNDLLVESTDGGATWTNRRPLAAWVHGAVQVGKGLAFITHQPVDGADGGRPTEVGIWYLADMTVADPGPVELAERIPVPPSLYSDIGSRLKILPAGDGFMVVMALDAAWRSGRLDIRLFDSVGALLDSNVTELREEMELDVSTAVLAGGEDGEPDLVLLRWDGKSGGVEYTAYHSGDLFRTETSHKLPALWEPPMLTVRLEDGRIGCLGTRNVAAGMERAAWTVSADGATWTEPVLIRPEGGFDQEIWGVTSTPDGRVVVVMGDNQLMRAGGTGLNQIMDGLVLRIAPPAP